MNLEKAFATKAKTLHIVQAEEDYLLCLESAELSLQDFPKLKFRLSLQINCEWSKSHETNQSRKQVKSLEFFVNWECRDWIMPLFA